MQKTSKFLAVLAIYVSLFLGAHIFVQSLTHAEEIPYKVGPDGGQIILLDDNKNAITNQDDYDQRINPDGKIVPLKKTGTQPGIQNQSKDPSRQTPGTVQQAQTPAAPPQRKQVSNVPNWEKLRRQLGDHNVPELQPIQQSDFDRLDRELEAKQAIQGKKKNFQEEYRKRKQAKQDVHEKVKGNLADKRGGRKVNKPRTPSANQLDLMMESLMDKNVSKANKQRITAVLFVHQDIYRNEVSRNIHFHGDTPKVKEFLKWKQSMQADVIQRMGTKYKAKYGEALKAPVIPFSYNNVMSDDDIITGSGKKGRIMEKLYVESLDEIIRERAGRPMAKADRLRVDVNGLAWDMTQKGALNNYWHKEKYINPQSGYANQQKLLSAGDNAKVYTFDDDGKLILLKGSEATAAIKRLAVDVPMKIPGIDIRAGTGSMSDYIRMANMHKVEFKEGIATIEEVQAFTRNQKYSGRVDDDFLKIAGGTHPELVAEHAKFMTTSKNIRKKLSIHGVAFELQKEYKIKILLENDIVDFKALTKAMKLHQNKQLTIVLPKLMGAVASNESYKILKWLKTASTSNRAMLRKQMALTYAPLTENQRSKIVADLDIMKAPEADRAFLKNVLQNDTKQINEYAKMMGLKTKALSGGLKLFGDNHEFVQMFGDDARFKDLNTSLARNKGGSKFKEFLHSKTARALNLDLMLGIEATTPKGKLVEGGGKLMQASMLLLAAQRAYSAGNDETEGVKQIALAMFNMIPFVASTLRTSDGEYREASKEFMMDVLPPLALANLAGMGLNYVAQTSISSFTDSKLNQIAQNQLDQMTGDKSHKYFEESPDLPGFYRIKNRQELNEYMDEVSPALGRLAKFPSLISQHVDAKMQKHKQVQLNNQALVTCLWFEGFKPPQQGGLGVEDFVVDKLITYNVNSVLTGYKIDELKSKVYENGVPAIDKALPVERMAAKIILENMSIRAQLYESELNAFIDRIERLYNKQKNNDQGSNAIIQLAIKKLQELHANAPKEIVESPNATLLLEEEFIDRENYLTSYHPKNIEDAALQQEMQQLLDNFRLFINKLALGVDFFLENRYLDLKADYYGGSKNSMEPLSEEYVLAGDQFRVGISARVNDRRKQSKWTAYYYIFTGKSWDVLGQKKLKPNRYKPENPGKDVLWGIIAPEKDSFITVKRKQLEKNFTNVPGIYEVYPVLAFGDWETDPLKMLGATVLQNPIEYAQLFKDGTMAFIGEPLEIKIAKAQVSVRMSDAVYRDQVAQVEVLVNVPEYAKLIAELTDVEVYSAKKDAKEPKLSPSSLKTISANSDKPSVIEMTFPEKTEEGQYILSAKVRFRGILDEHQPQPILKSFDYIDSDPPQKQAVAQPSDLPGLLTETQSINQQIKGIQRQTASIVKRINGIGILLAKYFTLADQQLTDIKSEQDNNKNTMRIDDSFLNQLPDIDAISLRISDIRNKIETETLALCKTYQQVKDTSKISQLDQIIIETRSASGNVSQSFETYSQDKLQLNGVKERLNGLERELQKFKQYDAYKKRLTDVNQMIEKCQSYAQEVDTLIDDIQDQQQRASSLNSSLYVIMEKVNTLDEVVLSEDQINMLKNIHDLKIKIQGSMEDINGAESKLTQDALIDVSQIAQLSSRLKHYQEKAGLELLTTSGNTQKQVSSAIKEVMSKINAAEIFYDPIDQAKKNAEICLQRTEDLYASKTSSEKRESGADCSDFLGTKAKWLAEVNEVRCVCIDADKKYNNTLKRCATRSEFSVTNANCEDFPGTKAQWHEDSKDVRCDCIDPAKKYNSTLGRCISREEFEVAKMDCSQWTNSTAIWDATNQQAVCDCTGDFQWNKTQTTCIKTPQVQVANTNCSKWPNSKAVWNSQKESSECDCVGDYEWNSPKNDACRIKKSTQLSQFDCSKYPNSTAAWSSKKQSPYCECTGDYELNNAKDGCRIKKELQVADGYCSTPGTHPRWNDKQEKVSCYCDEGTWNSSQGRCISGREQALSSLNCSFCETPFYDTTTKKARCICASGCGYDSKISDSCLPNNQLARLQRERQQKLENKNRRWEEEQRRKEEQEKAERRKYCEESLAKLNNSVLQKQERWQQMFNATSARDWGCEPGEIRAAEKGQWRGSSPTSGGGTSGNTGGGSRGGGDVYFDPNAPIYPQQCHDGSGIFGTVGSGVESCMSNAQYEKEMRKYEQAMRRYNSRR